MYFRVLPPFLSGGDSSPICLLHLRYEHITSLQENAYHFLWTNYFVILLLYFRIY